MPPHRHGVRPDVALHCADGPRREWAMTPEYVLRRRAALAPAAADAQTARGRVDVVLRA